MRPTTPRLKKEVLDGIPDEVLSPGRIMEGFVGVDSL